MNDKIEKLRAVIDDESLAPEKREEAAQVLARLESDPKNHFGKLIDDLKKDCEAYVIEQNDRFKVCSDCYRKQNKDRAKCEQCGAASWQPAIVDSVDGKRHSLIAASTDYATDELNWHIAHNSTDLAFAAHCARILELRGIHRCNSYWERGGFDFYGKPVARQSEGQ